MTDAGIPQRHPQPRSVVKLDAGLLADARAAVRFLRVQGEPDLQLGDLLDRLVGNGLEHIRCQYNDGQPFSTPGTPLPRGRQLQ